MIRRARCGLALLVVGFCLIPAALPTASARVSTTPGAAHAHPRVTSKPKAIKGSIYMTTDAAYNAFDPLHAVPPPMVDRFPASMRYLAAWVAFSGGTVHRTSFRVDFIQGRRTVRRGVTYPSASNPGRFVLELPGDSVRRLGAYKAVLYLGNRPAASASFTVIHTPGISAGYMIASTVLGRRNLASGSRPPRTVSYKARAARVGIYVAYTGASARSTISAVVYDRYGRLSYRSAARSLGPKSRGALALILPAASGAYPKGVYRTDVYADGALVLSLPWTAR